MSVISTNHDVVDFDSKKSSAMTGQRLSKIIYRTREGKEQKQSQCVSVPVLSIPELLATAGATIYPVILEAVQNYQDKIIKELVQSGKTQIADEEISITAICSYQSEESTGGRLTKELIACWFDSSVSELLTVAIAEKLGVSAEVTAAEETRVLMILDEYKSKFSALAGGKTHYSTVVAEKLIKAIEITGTSSDDEITGKLMNRLVTMKTAVPVDLFDL